jgi:hypothetical protein
VRGRLILDADRGAQQCKLRLPGDTVNEDTPYNKPNETIHEKGGNNRWRDWAIYPSIGAKEV